MLEKAPPENIQTILARNLRNTRKKLGYSQMALAERADISNGFLNDIERERRWVSPTILQRLADALKVKPFMLLLDREDESFDKYNLLTSVMGKLKENVDGEIEKTVLGFLSKKKKSL